MKVFDFDPADHREHYAEHGWVHVPGGADPEFLELLRQRGRREAEALSGRGIGGKMDQELFDFPSEVDLEGHLFAVVAAVAGLRHAGMTLSERHLKAYHDDVPEDPTAHKDRLSSQVSVGISIDIPQGSRLVLYPTVDRWTNPFNFSGALIPTLPEDRHPDVLLDGADAVEIEDGPGDVVLFEGSSMWHKRRRAGGAINLYMKFNDFGSDPLGEDPRTEQRQEATRAALEQGELDGLTAVPARRLDTVTRQFTREPGHVRLVADVWGRTPVALSAAEAELIEGLGDGRPAGELDGETVRRLAGAGVLDLVRAG
jgi:hypothetical protein